MLISYRVTACRLSSLAEVQSAASVAGNTWFSPSNMRYFGCRLGASIYVEEKNVLYFVSSERDGFGSDRRQYTVRRAYYHAEGFAIDTVGDFLAYDTRGKAVRAMKKAASEEAGAA